MPSFSANTIYIAGSSKERPLIQNLMAEVRGFGYRITHDWTKHEGFDLPDREVTDELLTAAAVTDYAAVEAAAVLWYVTPAVDSGLSEGSHAELGAARAWKKPIIVSGYLSRGRIFPRDAHHRLASHEEALELLRDRLWIDADLLRLFAPGVDEVAIPKADAWRCEAAVRLRDAGAVTLRNETRTILLRLPESSADMPVIAMSAAGRTP
jgi:hypothetical protein